MKNNKKGAALMQVLLITIVLAGIATMVLRATLSRTLSSRRTQRTVSAQMLIESCMAEINDIWSAKTPKAFQKDLEDKILYCKARTGMTCTDKVKDHTCKIQDPYNTSVNYEVKASFDGSQIIYTIEEGSNKL